mmetsp:Transcript_28388/g.47725  ORF Transcript_28388/g.47725 Transcript_28388/m.47725 type:complete len:87 (+) Transcript_28388:1585-1845(+)
MMRCASTLSASTQEVGLKDAPFIDRLIDLTSSPIFDCPFLLVHFHLTNPPFLLLSFSFGQKDDSSPFSSHLSLPPSPQEPKRASIT